MLRGFSLKSRWWLAVLQVVLLLATLVTPAAAASEPLPLTGPQLIQLLREYNVVRGDDQGNLNLDKAISRAEMITIMVRALGKEEDAKLYKGFSPFPDAVGHWAETNIAYAHFAKLVKGDDQGRARPQDKITYAEALTLLLRLLGKEPTTGEWPLNIMLAASEAGLVPEGVTYANIRDYAVRGPIFVTLAKGLLTVKAPSGKPFLAEYLDQTPPQVTVDPILSPTLDARVTVSGTARDAQTVLVNGTSAMLGAGGRFSVSVDLNTGTNTITVVAGDFAGNSRTETLTVVRNSRVARIDVTGPNEVNVGDTVDIKAVAFDSSNKVVDTTVTATLSGTAGSYNNNKFTATTVGTSTITFRAGELTKTHTVNVVGPSARVERMQIVLPGTTPNPNDTVTVRVQMLDNAGNLVAEDNGRQIGLTASGVAGVTVSPTISKTVKGEATFAVTSASGGVVALMATTTSNLAAASAQLMVATPIRIVLSASPNTLYATGAGSSVIRATLVNSANIPQVNTTAQDIVVQLRRSGVGDGSLSNNLITIRRGQSSSEGYDAIYMAGYTAGSLNLNGDVISGNVYTVLGTTINLVAVGTPIGGGGGTPLPTSGPAARLQFLGNPGPTSVSSTIEVVLRVVDNGGNSVSTGNYPFTVKVRTSNNDPVGPNGLPTGVSLTLGSTAYTPTGSANGGFTGVTSNGIARLRLSYNKSGKVTLEPVVSAAVNPSFDDQGTGYTTMASSIGLAVSNFEGMFSNGTWSTAQLSAAYTNVATGLAYTGATQAPVPTGAVVTLTTGLYDLAGGLVPDGRAATATLYRTSDNTLIATKSITSGTVDFTITAPATESNQTYRVSVSAPNGTVNSNEVTVYTKASAPTATPVINAARGAYANGTAHDPLKVALDDAYLQLLVQGNTAGFGQIKVYRAANNYLIHKSPIVDLSTIQVVNVPKSLLTNSDSYRVTVDNGFGSSPFSSATGTVVISSQISPTITAATYDAATQKLYLTVAASGYYYNTNASIIPSKLTITAPGGEFFVPSIGKVDSANNYFVIDLSTDPSMANPPAGQTSLTNTSAFAGTVQITGAAGWYERSDGGIASALTTGATVSPFAAISRAYLDITNRQLLIDTVGVGVNPTFNREKFSFGQVLTLNNNSFPVSGTSVPGRYAIGLNSLTQDQLNALDAYSGSLTASTGWYSVGANQVGTTTAPILAMISVSSASYSSTGVLRINGSGFLRSQSSRVRPDQITIVNQGVTPITSVTLTDPDNAVTIVSDNVMEISLGATDKGRIANMSGSLVFLRTSNTWMSDTGNRQAPQVSGYQCGVGFTN